MKNTELTLLLMELQAEMAKFQKRVEDGFGLLEQKLEGVELDVQELKKILSGHVREEI